MEVLLIRHGNPDYANDCLTATGRAEARRLAAALAELPIASIYVSPLGRARETCRFTVDRKSVSPVVLDWLEERGILRDGVYLWEASGETFLRRGADCGRPDGFSLRERIPEGDEQFVRVKHGFDALMDAHGYVRDGELYRVQEPSDERIAVFCHKGVILTLLADILHWPLAMIFVSLEIHPTGVTRLQMVENDGLAHFKAIAINGLTHLRTHAHEEEAGHGRK